LISNDIDRLPAFYADAFDAEVGPTNPHGEKGGETMTMIRIGPHTELNVVTIESNPEPGPSDADVGTRATRPLRPAGGVRGKS
jgi:hypothetical protein